MGQIDDIKRTMDQLLRALHDMRLGDSPSAIRMALERLQTQIPVEADLDPESTVKEDVRTRDMEALARRISANEGNVRTLFERGLDSGLTDEADTTFEFGEPTSANPGAADFIQIDLTDKDGTDISNPVEKVNIFGAMDRSLVPFNEFGWDQDTLITWLRFHETVTHEATVISGVMIGANDRLPAISGGNTWDVVQLDNSTPKVFVLGPVRAQG